MSHVRKERGAGADRETEASEALTATRRVGGGAQPFVHPTAVIDPGAVLGVEVRVWHFSHVMGGARIGAGSTLGQNVYVGGEVVVGERCRIANNVSLYDGVTLEAEVFVGPSVVFTNVKTPRAFINRRHAFLPTHVGRGATLGANATVVCGRVLGAYCFVAAGAVVTADVLPHALVAGVPARVRGWVCVCGERLAPVPGERADGTRLLCAACGTPFRVSGRGPGGEIVGVMREDAPAPPPR